VSAGSGSRARTSSQNAMKQVILMTVMIGWPMVPFSAKKPNRFASLSVWLVSSCMASEGVVEGGVTGWLLATRKCSIALGSKSYCNWPDVF
jgi:hypothetical protein